MINKESYMPFSKGAYGLMKKSILKGHFRPGERLTENRLSKKEGMDKQSLGAFTRNAKIFALPRSGLDVVTFFLSKKAFFMYVY
jgi:hypothetical protein